MMFVTVLLATVLGAAAVGGGLYAVSRLERRTPTLLSGTAAAELTAGREMEAYYVLEPGQVDRYRARERPDTVELLLFGPMVGWQLFRALKRRQRLCAGSQVFTPDQFRSHMANVIRHGTIHVVEGQWAMKPRHVWLLIVPPLFCLLLGTWWAWNLVG